MKYLLLNSLKSGGAERVAQILSSVNLFDAIIILEKDQDYKVPINVIKISNHSFETNSLYKTIFIPIYSWRLKKILKNDDIVVSFAERSNFTNIVSKIFIRHKAILTLHSNLSVAFKNKKKFLYYILIKILYKFSDVIISVSNGIKKGFDLITKVKKTHIVIYNPVDLITINKLKNDITFFNKDFYKKSIITVGRLSQEKAQWNILKIFKSVLAKEPESKLLILGDGNLKKDLVSYSKKLGLKTFSFDEVSKISEKYDVYFLGYQENPYKFISKSSIFVLTSIFEGFPMVILESMACGIPVISSDCDFGPREILKSGDKNFGILLPVINTNFNLETIDKNEKIWTETILSLLLDCDTRDGYSKLSIDRVEDFSIDKIKKQWEDLFNTF